MTTLTRTRTLVAALATAAATLTLLVAPGQSASAQPRAAGDAPGPTAYEGPGPYGVGVRELTLPSGSKVAVWYPARKADVKDKEVWSYDLVDWLPPALATKVPEGFTVAYPSGGVRGVPVRRGEFPLVVFSHGYGGFRTQSSFLTSALASWGFVVAAPEHPSRDITRLLSFLSAVPGDVDDLSATISLIGKQDRAQKSWLFKHVDMSEVAAIGHSAGGRASEQVAVADKRVDTFVGLAGASNAWGDPVAVPDVPGMIVAATDDGVVSLEGLQSAYAALDRPKRFVEIGGSGHLVFSDLCEIGSGSGGLLDIGYALGFPDILLNQFKTLATDGCIDPAVAPTDAWPAIQHVVVAYLRRTFGFDRTNAALTGLEDAYPGVVVANTTAATAP